ncbi:Respiratory nitrate reductase 1 gamma chain [Pseudidiomarina piscicola]|uniref:nitrate reductase (quinone) n=1 Tax=Pseudidiomarina piscicola TaxID=2614830 RepID=A0A6S6WPB3_9GAMM|nr:respiratory nitrate reductase subunit gamma [Pseudidiomarina piscicola]CAB0151487.1 Respiratory nitrate reductase 1 gamma chain [Pseudidiomarina piscicola]VZT40966.1 Respiratory nitrate reductase 1 gamma chain [Pseudomonas aeruginosa]
MNYLNTFFFGIYPYIAIAVLVIGTWIRYDREQFTWKTSSSQLLEKKQLRRGSIAFHIGILAIFAGHFVGLLTPSEVWHVLGVSTSAKQIIAMGAGGLFGVICFYGMTILIVRRLKNPRIRANSSTMDIAILLLLYAQLILGLLSIFVSLGHLDGSEMLKLMAWAQNTVTFDATTAVAAMTDVHWIFKLHITLGMTIFLVFPFTRLVHMFSVPVQYLRRQHQVVRQKAAR